MSLFDDRIVPGGHCPPGSARRSCSPGVHVLCALGVLSLLVALALCSAGAAQARDARLFAGSFGSAASSTPDPYPLSNPSGVAVDDVSHDVYVTDPGNHRVEKFTASGEFLLAFGANVGGPGVNVCGGLVACSAGTPGSAPGELTTPAYVAVDNSGGPSAGDVYVADTGDDLVAKFTSSGELISSWGVGGQLSGAGVTSPPEPVPGPFGPLRGIAVDPEGNLWVHGMALEPHHVCESPRLYEFAENGSVKTDWTAEPQCASDRGIAVNASDDIFIESSNIAFEYGPAGEEIGIVNYEPTNGIAGESVAVDTASGALYQGTTGQTVAYYENCHPSGNDTCAPTEVFGAGYLHGFAVALAVDPVSSAVYAVNESAAAHPGEVVSFVTAVVPDVVTLAPSSETSTSVTLNGTVNPDGASLHEGIEGCRFEWGETSAYGHVVACDKNAAQIGDGSEPVEVHAAISDLMAGRTYHFRLVAANDNDVNGHLDEPTLGQDNAFGPPVVSSESASGVTATGAQVEGVVSSDNTTTRVQIEYGLEASYGEDTQVIDLSVGEEEKSILQHLSGLMPDTTYHYRVVAENVFGMVVGEDHVFTTQPASVAPGLIDGRRWRLVSPQDKHGAVIFAPGNDGGILQSAASGSSFTFPVESPTEEGTLGLSGVGDQVLAIRAAGGGWSSRDLAVAHSTPTGGPSDFGVEYRAFSPDLSTAALEPVGAFTSLAPEVFPADDEQTPYLRHDATCGSEPETCYAPLVTHAEGDADLIESAKVDTGTVLGAARFLGASPDMQNVILASSVQLTEVATPPGVTELYEWSASAPPTERLRLVSRVEDGEPSSNTAELGYQGSGGLDARGAVSNDGSRVFWTENGSALYVWDAASGVSTRLDVVQPGATGSGNAEPEFQLASGDGSRVLFTDAQRLTADSGASSGSDDLYECEIVEEAGGLRCVLSDLTPLEDGKSAELAGTVTGASEDASWVYFVANGVLGQTAGEGARLGKCVTFGPQPRTGATCNLYVMHRSAEGWQSPRLVAVLSEDDGSDWTNGVANLGELTARVSPNGLWLAFMSDRSLTGYDNRDAASGKPDEEVFLYHASEGQGSLVCGSCDPTGARPHGVEYAQIYEGMATSALTWEPYRWLAAFVPGYKDYESSHGIYQPRYLSDEGRLFFDSTDALTPQATNGNVDVYEYEPVGVGGSAGCTVVASGYSPGQEGCIALISSGTAIGASVFADASENGDDAFFLTAEKLTGQDIDSSVDVYDAQVCNTTVPCPAEPGLETACASAEACRIAPSPQPEIYGAPGSATFAGDGNLAATAPAAGTVKTPTAGKHHVKHKRKRTGKRKRSHASAHRSLTRRHDHRHDRSSK